jgi:ATP-dependent exoDNAse (exonuclease V) beta subunit
MTIHKSKGLEFKCVILPIEDTTFSVNDRQSEWRWVEPYLPDDLPVELPPYVPIETVKALRETQHADIYDEYYNAVLMDKINTEYVAFTRAVNELYIFAPVGFDSRKNEPKVKPGSLAELILQILPEINESQPGSASSEQLNDLLPIGCVKSEDNKFIIGSPINLVDLQKSKNDKNGKKEKRIEKTLMEDYKVNPNTEALKYKESTSSVIDQDEDADPRSEGNLMHAVMSELITEADLTRALLSIKVNGLATVAMLTSVSQLIEKALSEVRDYGWFDGRYKVINERPILRCRAGSKRPDRIMISSDGDVVVVDYKFGEHRNDKLYSEQVAEYIELLKSTGRFRSFAGYVWYVKQSQIVKVI